MDTAVAFRFPARRYHATPWDRHVNEAEVEWPPSSWRILRALIATWHSKIDPEDYPEHRLDDLMQRLSGVAPEYRLPRAVHAHTRHYMPVRVGKSEKKTLIFDAFASVDPDEDLVVVWPGVELAAAERELLSHLLEALGYLGRAESWVLGRLLDGWQGSPNCLPSSPNGLPPSDELDDPILLPVPRTPAAYFSWRAQSIHQHGLDQPRLNKRQQRLLDTLPERLLDALRIETATLRAQGWSQPPGATFVTYYRKSDCLSPTHEARETPATVGSKITTVRLALSGRPLPRIEDAIKVGELTRFAVMYHAEQLTEAGEIPSVLSGHDMPEGNRHGHAFYLPEDRDGDGRIDHILIHAEEGLNRHCVRALSRIRRLWQRGGAEWHVVFETFGGRASFPGHPYLAESSRWHSVTPYLHPWFRKKKFSIEDQIRRECEERHLPRPELRQLETVSIHGRDRRPVHFHRFRKKRGATQPDTRGSFWELTFPEAIKGPLALGFGCHFGLGLFQSIVDSDD